MAADHEATEAPVSVGRISMKRPDHTLVARARQEMRKRHPDILLARSLLSRASGKGNAEATYALATWHLHGHHMKKSLKEGVRLLRQAAKAGFPSALYDLAVCYETGQGAPRNVRRAFEYYVQAADRGDADAIHEVGRCYYYGVGVPQDRKAAWTWLDRAKALGVDE